MGEDTTSFLEDEYYGNPTDEEESYMAEERQEYLRNLRQNCMMEYESWNRYFGSIRNAIDFQVLDENGSILMNYAKAVSYTHLDVYKRQEPEWFWRQRR